MKYLIVTIIVIIVFGIVTIKPSFAESEWKIYYLRGGVLPPDHTFKIPYKITNGTLQKIDVDFGAIVLTINSKDNGILEIKIPKNLPYTNNPLDVEDIFIILVDGIELRKNVEAKTTCFRELVIPFDSSSQKIELAGTMLASTHPIVTPKVPIECIDETMVAQILSPRQQIANGVLPENVVCKEGLELIFKSRDNSPACVKPQTTVKLLERGWATTHVDLANKESNKDKTLQQLNEEYGYVPGELIISLKELPSTGENSSFHNRMINLIPNYEDIVIREIPQLNVASIRVPVGEEQNYIEMLKQYPDVKAVELNRIMKIR